MHKIKKYSEGSGISATVLNPVMGGLSTPGYFGGYLYNGGYAPTSSTNVNAGIGVALSGLSSTLGTLFGGEIGNAIGMIGGNLGQALLSSKSLKEGFKNFAGLDLLESKNMSKFGTKEFSGFGNGVNLAGTIASGILDRSTSHQRTSGRYGSLAGGVDLIGGILGGKYGGYGVLGQLGMSAVNKITGGTDGMTISDSLLGSSSLAGGLTAINPVLGAAYAGISGINSATGKITAENDNNDYFSKESLASMWGSYSKSLKDHEKALQYGGKKYGGISRLTGEFGRADRRVRSDNQRTDTLMDIYDRAELGRIRGSQMADINSLDYRLNTFGGYDLYGTRIGKKGMKLPSKLEILRIKNILEYKKGGLMSVIPEGALHARKNHMEGAGKDYTHKGIPVMDKDGEQQAEIERNEIIFSLDVTQKLERLKNDGSDEAAIKAGKLLVEEIFHNTDDRTGLIQEIIGQNTTVFKNGGIIVEAPTYGINVEEPEIESFKKGGMPKQIDPLNNPRANEYIINQSKIPTLIDYLEGERAKVMERAVGKAVTRYEPYTKISPNCIATALDNYAEFEVPMVYSNQVFAQDPEKYGFERIDFDGDYSKLPWGILFQDLNNESYPDIPGHMVTFVGIGDDGKPRFSYSDGGIDPESMHRYVKYPFIKRGNAYRFIGTPEWIKNKTEEYYKLYPTKKFLEGGILEEGDNAIMAEEPEIYNDNVEEFKKGGILIEEPFNYRKVEYFKKGGRKGRSFEEIWRILNADENFDDTFIDEPEYSDDLSYQAQPKSVRNKITEEEWEYFLDELFLIEDLVNEAKQLNPRFIQRLLESPRGIDFIDKEGNRVRGSHYLISGEDEFGGYVIPMILEQQNGSLKFIKDEDEAIKLARKNNNMLRFDSPMDAFRFATRYKRFFPEFFKNFK